MSELLFTWAGSWKTRGSDVTSYYQGRASPYRIGWNRILVALGRVSGFEIWPRNFRETGTLDKLERETGPGVAGGSSTNIR